MYDAIVIGGGIAGAATAYHLARDGADALLVDRRDPGRATEVAAGILSPATTAHVPEPAYPFAVDAVGYYPSLLAELGNALPDDAFSRCGLAVVDAGDDPAAYEGTREAIRARTERFGHPPADAITERAPAELRERVPALADARAVLYYEDAARVCGGPLAGAMIEAGESHGLDTMAGSAERIRAADGAVSGVVVDGEEHATSNAVVAGGAWSGAFGDQLGLELPVGPLRGQVVHLDPRETDAGGADDWPIVQDASREHSLVPWPDGRVVAAATMEDAGFAPHTTAAGIRGLLDETLRLAPGLAGAAVAETRVGLRPLTADDLPVIGEAPVDGAFVATGHGPLGLMLGPYTGKVVADAVLGGPVEADVGAFAPARFA